MDSLDEIKKDSQGAILKLIENLDSQIVALQDFRRSIVQQTSLLGFLPFNVDDVINYRPTRDSEWGTIQVVSVGYVDFPNQIGVTMRILDVPEEKYKDRIGKTLSAVVGSDESGDWKYIENTIGEGSMNGNSLASA